MSMASLDNLKMINNYWEPKVLKENPEFEFEPFATHLQIARFPELVFFSIINGQSLQNNNSVIILFLYFDLNLGKFHVPSWSKVELLMVYTSQFVMWFHQHIPYFITLTLKPGQRKWNKNEKDYINRKLTEIEQIPHHRLWLGTAAEENNKILLIMSFFYLLCLHYLFCSIISANNNYKPSLIGVDIFPSYLKQNF